MKYVVPVSGVTLGMPHDSPEWKTFTKYEVYKNSVHFYLGHGVYDGDRKNIILMENESNMDIYVICKAKVQGVDNFHAFYMSEVGQSVDIIWCDRFQCYYISSSGSYCLSKEDFEKSSQSFQK